MDFKRLKEPVRKNLQHIILLYGLLIIFQLAAMDYGEKMIFLALWALPVTIAIILDYQYMLLFNELVFLTAISGIMLAATQYTSEDFLINAIGGSLIMGGFLQFIRLMWRNSLGMGDVKFALALGCILSIEKAIYALWLAFVLGGMVALMNIMLMRMGYMEKKEKIAFGPFLALGTMISFLFEENIRLAYGWYL